ncbi:MAG: hypothetical protein R2747_19400 [Pyrinomonadaceae bacterium]
MKRIAYHLVASVLCFLSILQPAFAGTVSLDTSFNTSGYRIQHFNQLGSVGRSVAVQTDGRIILGGWTRDVALFGAFAAMRLNTDGTLDTGFSDDGVVITQYSAFNQVEKLLIQPDGRIILGGTRHFGQNDFAMVRYNTNGSLDTSFDGDGGAASPINIISEDFGKDMVLQTDGKIVMVGSTAADQNSPTDIGIIRRNVNGSLDTSFNGTGILRVQFPNVNAGAEAVLIQNDGKIVIGGFLFTGINNALLLMRFNPNGFLDTTFGTNGLTLTPVNSSNNSIRTLAQQSDGKILAGSQNLIARYSLNGILDGTFGNSGLVTAPQTVQEIIVTEGDRFMIGGSVGSAVAASRFNSDGNIDTSFNNTGTFSASATGSSCFGSSIALQNDGKIIIGGNCGLSVPDFAVFRLVESSAGGAKPIFDLDGDSKTDVSIFRPGPGEWWYLRSSDGGNRAFQFGSSTDKLVPADFTGDGSTDIAFWRESTGEWFVLRSEDSSFYSFPFGTTNDIPVPADYDGDGKADPAIFRPSSATWFIIRSTDGGTTIAQFGANTDLPVPADYDGDGKADLAIFRPGDGSWWLNRSTAGLIVYNFGTGTDRTVQGDYTGDGKADVAFWRPTTGEWFILRSEDASFYSGPFGAMGDVPVPGDYDGDGRSDLAVFRPSVNTWFIDGSTVGFSAVSFGIAGDIPVPSAFVR